MPLAAQTFRQQLSIEWLKFVSFFKKSLKNAKRSKKYDYFLLTFYLDFINFVVRWFQPAKLRAIIYNL